MVIFIIFIIIAGLDICETSLSKLLPTPESSLRKRSHSVISADGTQGGGLTGNENMASSQRRKSTRSRTPAIAVGCSEGGIEGSGSVVASAPKPVRDEITIGVSEFTALLLMNISKHVVSTVHVRFVIHLWSICIHPIAHYYSGNSC
jgi:hypothetical protein